MKSLAQSEAVLVFVGALSNSTSEGAILIQSIALYEELPMNGRKARTLRKLAKAIFDNQQQDLKQQAVQTPYDLEPVLDEHGIQVGYKPTSPRRLNQNSKRYLYQYGKKHGVMALAWMVYTNTKTVQSLMPRTTQS